MIAYCPYCNLDAEVREYRDDDPPFCENCGFTLIVDDDEEPEELHALH